MHTTRKCARYTPGNASAKRDVLPLKQSLGERYATNFMLARFLDFATSCGVDRLVAPSTDCV